MSNDVDLRQIERSLKSISESVAVIARHFRELQDSSTIAGQGLAQIKFVNEDETER